ncbi:hypothetical protein UlMin_026138 [Ulmus minor]
MPNSNQETQDQRNDSSMEGSTAMTIEFLRARLLSERSVSRSARQRADELAKRVEELEEQLKIVSLQRKMAEKATVDVLSILENRGISDTSETFDSSSDHEETHQQSQVGNNYPNREERSVVSKRRSEVEEHSGSDLDSSPVNGRSLSWKGHGNSPRREKYKDPSMRRRNAFSSMSSSPKHHLAKSCRQIRRRETRTVVEDSKTEPIKFDPQEDGVATSSESPPNGSDSGLDIVREDSETQKALLEGPLSESGGNQRSMPNCLDVNGHVRERDKDMEKALEHQAQLIGQYEEMEKAQREWEEKFRENINNTLDPCDPGNHSDVTEERDEVKAQTLYSSGVHIPESEEPKSKEVDVSSSKESKPQANGFLPPSNGDLKHQISSSTSIVASGSQAQNFSTPTTMEKETRENQRNSESQPSDRLQREPLLHEPLGNQYSGASSSDGSRSFHKKDLLRSQNEHYALVPHNPPNALGGVLDALKQAKFSLQQKMQRFPQIEGTQATKAIEPAATETRVGDRIETHGGYAGLFRLPTDFSAEEASAHSNFLSSESLLPSATYLPDNGLALTTAARFMSTPYIENRSSTPYMESRSVTPYMESRSANRYIESRPAFPSDNRFVSGGNTSLEYGSGASTLNSRFDPYMDTGPSSFNRYTHNTYPPFPDLMPRTPTSSEGLPRPFPSASFGTPADRMSFYNDHSRPNMYR